MNYKKYKTIYQMIYFNEEVKEYNIGHLFDKKNDFKVLSNITSLFEQVKIDTGGYGISWNDDLDLSCNELYFNGKSVSLL